jgi:hypothetical protein
MSPVKKPYGAVRLARLAADVIDPITAKRGFAKANLVSSWGDVVGPRYAATTQPEKLHWPRDGYGAVLTVRVGGPGAVFLQHEKEQFLGRINTFLGYAAVTELRIVQKPIGRTARRAESPPDLPGPTREAIRESVAELADGGLRDALMRLATAIATDRLARP